MRRIRVVVVTVVALAALSACGSSDETEKDGAGQVATLTTPEAKPSSAAAGGAAKADPPRERIDTTAEEFEAMLVPFNKCLKKNGLSSQDGKVSADRGMSSTKSLGKRQQKQDAIYRDCEKQFYPLPPWEKDPANPEARDFAVSVVKCLKHKGVKYVEVSDDGLSYALGGDQNDARSISQGMELAPVCEREVAAAQK